VGDREFAALTPATGAAYRRRGSIPHRPLSDLTSAFAPVACAPFRLRCADRGASSHAGLWFRRRGSGLVLVEPCAPPSWFGSRFHALLAGVGWWLVAPPHCPHPPGCSAMRFASLPHRRSAPPAKISSRQKGRPWMRALKKLASAGEVGNENSRPEESFFWREGKALFRDLSLICHKPNFQP